MKIIVVSLIALVLVGCATPNEIRGKGAAFSVNSEKSARDVTGCIAGEWENAPFFSRFTGTVNTSISKGGYSITAYGKNASGTWPVLIAQIDETGSGSDISYFTTKPMVDESYYTDALQKCK
jgi:hypothetical protein